MKLAIRLVILLVFVAALGLAAMPAAANLAGTTVGFAPGNVESGKTVDITLTVDLQSPDDNYLWQTQLTVPNAWTINSVALPPAETSGCTEPLAMGTIGQMIWWGTSEARDSCGVWDNGVYNFTANVTINSCSGAPWDLSWALIGDNWGSSPRELYGTYSVGCDDIAAEPVPGCDVTINIPSSAVGASMVADAPVYWKPGEITPHVLPVGTHVRAIGMDVSGAYYQVLYVCDFLWVPASAVGPNYDAPWNGAALPTAVIEVPESSSKTDN